MEISILLLGIVILYIAINLKTTRPDGTLVRTRPYQRILSFLSPSRNSAITYMECNVPAENLVRWIAEQRERGARIDVAVCVMAAMAITLDSAPRVNRFIAGYRLYQRKERKLTLSVLQKKNDRSAQVGTVSLCVGQEWTMGRLVSELNHAIDGERSGRTSPTEREIGFFLSLPRPVLSLAINVLKWLNHHNLLPAGLIANDPLFCSAFITNVGSIAMDPPYHHLYEWGNCPVFVMVGRIREMPVAENGKVIAKSMLPVRFSFDERIDDGINANVGLQAFRAALSNPHEVFGNLSGDGSSNPLTASYTEPFADRSPQHLQPGCD